MKRLTLRQSLKQTARSTLLITMALLLVAPNVMALRESDFKSILNNTSFYDPTDDLQGCESSTESTGPVDIDKLLRTIAKRESGGNPTAQASTSSASGKYQYIDGTWAGMVANYSEVSKYAHAKDAPEAVQDAVAYVEYSKKIIIYNGDLTKLALSHFLPASISNPALLDVTPSGNSITPRQYAAAFVEAYNSDAGAGIKLYYRDAPNLPAVSGEPSSSSTATPSEGCNQADGGGDVGIGKGSFTDSGEVKDFANVLANSKASDTAFGGGFVGCHVCAAVVSRVWRGKDIGYGIHDGTDGAIGMWRQYKGSLGHADRNPKKGAILLYTSSDPAGHVTIYLGDNRVLNDGQLWDAGKLENDWGVGYLGWIDPNEVGWTSVNAADNIRAALSSKLDRQCK